MKKLLLAFSALALVAVSCKDIQETDFLADGALKLTASVEQPAGTRTLVAGAGEVFWEKGDDIKVFAGTASGKFVSDLESTSSTAEFTGSLGGVWTEGSPLWAVYPYCEGASLDGEVLTAELPAVQTARGMSFAKDMNLSVARSTTASLQFYNVGGGVCFTLKEGGIQKVVFEGLNGEMLAGKIKVAFVDERPVVQEVTDGSTSVTLAAPEGKTLEEDGVWYYIVALPGILEKGFKLSFYKGNTVAQKTFPKAVTVKRSVYGEVRNADEGASYIPDTDENINFKDAKVKEIVVRHFDTGKDGELSYKEAAAVRSFYVAKTRAAGDSVSVFAGTDIASFDEIIYFTGLTKIEDGAFAGCTQLTSITIPANITEIGANAFKGCTGLQSITVLSETPPTIGEDAFADTNNCPIIVPAGTTETYVTAWGEYAPRIEGSQPDNEIWYTSSTGEVVAPNDANVFGATIISNTYKNGKGVITFDGPVRTIGNSAFCGYTAPEGDTGLKSIKIPEGVTSLGYFCFGYCTSLEEVSLPESLTELDTYCFHYCKGLKEIVFPAGIKRLGLGTCRECSSLSRAVLPEGLTVIGESAFQGCTVLPSLVIPETVTEIGKRAFYSCRGLAEITIPRGVTLIGKESFTSCRGLTELTIDAATVIDTSAFSSCNGLTTLLLSDKVVSVGYRAFNGCSGLTGITSMAQVPPPGGERMFYNTNNCPIYVPAESVEAYKAAEYWSDYADRIQALGQEPGTQPDNEIWYTTTDGQAALLYYHDFYGLSTEECFGASIVSHQYRDGKGVITFDKALTFLGKRAFTESSNLASMALPNSIKSIGESAFICCSALTEINLPNSLETIGDLAFRACSALESVHIPKMVTTIPYSAFTAMPGLSSISVDPENPVYDSRENCNAIIETETNRLITGCKNTIIPQSVTSIGETAFYACSSLTEMIIPDSVTEIRSTAFSQSGIEHVVVPASVKSIDAYVFQGCANLVTLVIEGSPSTIGRYAFRDCNKLAYFKIYSEIPPQAGNDFLGNTHNCPIYVPSGSVEAYKTASVWKSYASRIQGFELNPQPDNKIVYTSSDGLVVAPKNELAGQTDEECFGAKILSNEYTDGRGVINFDGYLKSIGQSAFYGCETLTDVVIPYGVSSIGKEAFSLCSNLGSVTLPESVTSIGEVAFGYCTKLTKIEIPAEVKCLEYAALMYCSSLTEITIPEGLTTIGKEALRYCSSLEKICLPASLTSIGEKAFGGCDKLVSITIPKKVTQIGKEAFLGEKELVRVKIEGATAIGEYAFQSCKKLTSITILDPGVSFSKKAFANCTGLNSIKIYSPAPPVGGEGMFDYSTCPIYVPAGSEDAYKSAPYWSDYADRIRGFEGEYQPDYEIWYTATSPGLVMCLTGTGYGANFVTNSYRSSEFNALFSNHFIFSIHYRIILFS